MTDNLEHCKAVAAERGGECLSTEYVNCYTPMRWRCYEHGDWTADATHVVSRGQWCPKCGIERRGRKRLSGIFVCQQTAADRAGKCHSKVYVSSYAPIDWECAFGHRWFASWSSVRGGSWCPYCCNRNSDMERRCRFIMEVLHDKMSFPTRRPFKNFGSKLELDCYNEEMRLALEYDGPQHRTGSFFYGSHPNAEIFERDRKKNALCVQEGIRLIRVGDIEATQETLVDVIIQKHITLGIPFTMPPPDTLLRLRNPADLLYKNIYENTRLKRLRSVCEEKNGTLLSDVWCGTGFRYDVMCAVGHSFTMDYYKLLSGERWCPVCRHDAKDAVRRIREQKRCNAVAVERGGECRSDKYTNSVTPLKWWCRKHDFEWMAVSGSVVGAGSWCPKCARERTDAAQAARKIGLERCQRTAIERDGLCLSTNYTGALSPMRWWCNKHQFEWSIPANNIINNKNWCPKCGYEKRTVTRLKTLRNKKQTI